MIPFFQFLAPRLFALFWAFLILLGAPLAARADVGGEGPPGVQRQITAAEYAALEAFNGSTGGALAARGWLQPDQVSWQGLSVEGFSADEAGNVLSVGYVSGISLAGLQLTGSISANLGDLPGLRSLDLSENRFTGEVPSSLGNLPELQNLLLQSNLLTGLIPRELGALARLGFLNLSHNKLSGTIPSELGNMGFLQELGLNDNFLTGSLEPILKPFGNLGSVRLERNFFEVESGSANRELIDAFVAQGKIVTFAPQLEIIRLSIARSSEGSGIEVSFFSYAGKIYHLSKSTDLENWVELSATEGGGGMAFGMTLLNQPATGFFRVHATVIPQ